jgi:hypothetical protein
MNLEIESRVFSIKGYARTDSTIVPIKIQIIIESTGEGISYIHKYDKSLELKENIYEHVTITIRSTWDIPEYVKEIVHDVAKGLGKAVCKSDKIIYRCAIPAITLSEESMLMIIQTIMEIIEKRQPEIK